MNAYHTDVISLRNDGYAEARLRPAIPQTLDAQMEPHVSLCAGQESALVRAAKAGDESAFLELYRRCLPKVSRTALRILKNSADADDVVQGCMLKAYSRLHQFDERAAFSTWVVKIGINDSLMLIRKRGKNRIESLDDCFNELGVPSIREIQDAAPSPEDHYGQIELLLCLRDAIGRLPRSVRDVLELQQRDDASIREISTSLNLSVAAVKSRLHRGRKALRKIMHDHRITLVRWQL